MGVPGEAGTVPTCRHALPIPRSLMNNESPPTSSCRVSVPVWFSSWVSVLPSTMFLVSVPVWFASWVSVRPSPSSPSLPLGFSVAVLVAAGLRIAACFVPFWPLLSFLTP